jgi:6-pyruvoyl-tetrahydropterin synthase
MKEVFSLFVDNLTILDCAVDHPIRGPIGMSWRVGIEFIGSLTEEGVVFDFSYAKKCAKKVIDSTADHAFITSRDLAETTSSPVLLVDDKWTYSGPSQAFFYVDSVDTSSITSSLQSLILNACKDSKDCAQLLQVKLTLTEENETGAFYYHYSHGLKTHYGSCQRLVHGHKSTIKIFVNGIQYPDLEKEVAFFYNDKHLAFWENITKDNISKEYIELSYTSSQGDFRLKMPRASIVIYPIETTVENISKYTAYWVKEQHPELLHETVIVKAYEGIEKGCIYSLGAGLGTHEHMTKLWTLADQHNIASIQHPELLKG